MLPKLTHIQWLVASFFQGSTELSLAGEAIRAMLEDNKGEFSLPVFYQLMKRMELAGYVTGTYRNIIAEGESRTFRYRYYSLTAAGLHEYKESIKFYVTGSRAV